MKWPFFDEFSFAGTFYTMFYIELDIGGGGRQ